jgi:hypothetical protein
MSLAITATAMLAALILGCSAGTAKAGLAVRSDGTVLAWGDNSQSQFSTRVQTLNRKCYALECNSSLAATNWTALCTNAGNGALRILTDQNATGLQRFYRMRQW